MRQRPARRGSVYVLVLSLSLIVAGIGLGALLLARIGQRAQQMTEQATKADLAAQSLADITVFRLNDNASWRTSYTNNVWTNNEIVGDAVFRLKLVDELDSDLSDDPNDPARLYAQATVGTAVRMYSVQLAALAPTNLVSNPGMEEGTTSWSGAYCSLQGRSDQVHGGARCLYVYNRTFSWSYVYQTLAGALQNGVTYKLGVWVKMDSGTSYVVIGIGTVATGSGNQSFTSAAVPVGTTWTEVSANLTPTWSGSLTEATIGVATQSGTTPFRIDDVSLVKLSTIGQLAPVPGTWRREVLP